MGKRLLSIILALVIAFTCTVSADALADDSQLQSIDCPTRLFTCSEELISNTTLPIQFNEDGIPMADAMLLGELLGIDVVIKESDAQPGAYEVYTRIGDLFPSSAEYSTVERPTAVFNTNNGTAVRFYLAFSRMNTVELEAVPIAQTDGDEVKVLVPIASFVGIHYGHVIFNNGELSLYQPKPNIADLLCNNDFFTRVLKYNFDAISFFNEYSNDVLGIDPAKLLFFNGSVYKTLRSLFSSIVNLDTGELQEILVWGLSRNIGQSIADVMCHTSTQEHELLMASDVYDVSATTIEEYSKLISKGLGEEIGQIEFDIDQLYNRMLDGEIGREYGDNAIKKLSKRFHETQSFRDAFKQFFNSLEFCAETVSIATGFFEIVDRLDTACSISTDAMQTYISESSSLGTGIDWRDYTIQNDLNDAVRSYCDQDNAIFGASSSVLSTFMDEEIIPKATELGLEKLIEQLNPKANSAMFKYVIVDFSWSLIESLIDLLTGGGIFQAQDSAMLSIYMNLFQNSTVSTYVEYLRNHSTVNEEYLSTLQDLAYVRIKSYYTAREAGLAAFALTEHFNPDLFETKFAEEIAKNNECLEFLTLLRTTTDFGVTAELMQYLPQMDASLGARIIEWEETYGGIWDGSAADSFAGGSGTELDPYLISNGAELAYLAQQVNSGALSTSDKYFKLTADIYLNDTSDWKNWAKGTAPENEWTPIGIYYDYDSDDNTPFCGNFDGDGHCISGIYINATESDGLGLFGYAVESTIKNLAIVDSSITGKDSVGGVVGDTSDSSIENCYNTGTISGNYSVGGVVGDTSDSSIENCYNTGTISGNDLVGGVAGDTSDSSIENCYNTGTISGDGFVGGVVGVNANNNSTVENCYNTGAVNGDAFIGGVVGCIFDSTVENCYNTGTINGNAAVGGVVGYVGGVAGWWTDSSIENCYNTGAVNSNASIGGVLGFTECDIAIENCYYLDTCCAYNGIGIALTDKQLKELNSYIGFDFNKVWTMSGNPN